MTDGFGQICTASYRPPQEQNKQIALNSHNDIYIVLALIEMQSELFWLLAAPQVSQLTESKGLSNSCPRQNRKISKTLSCIKINNNTKVFKVDNAECVYTEKESDWCLTILSDNVVQIVLSAITAAQMGYFIKKIVWALCQPA